MNVNPGPFRGHHLGWDLCPPTPLFRGFPLKTPSHMSRFAVARSGQVPGQSIDAVSAEARAIRAATCKQARPRASRVRIMNATAYGYGFELGTLWWTSFRWGFMSTNRI